jgi:hypothetical protein
VLVNHDTDLVDLVVRDAAGHRAVIHTTARHPFWDATRHAWVRVDHLRAGHRLRATDRHAVRVVRRVSPSVTSGHMWDLTVVTDHDFYVQAGHSDVLVHNCSAGNVNAWRLGKPIDGLTRAGNKPSWSTVRARYWKNAANDALDGEYSDANLARMRRGLAPQHDELGVSMELNHIQPRHLGGGNNVQNLESLWPWEHAAVDRFRFYTGPMP